MTSALVELMEATYIKNCVLRLVGFLTVMNFLGGNCQAIFPLADYDDDDVFLHRFKQLVAKSIRISAHCNCNIS